MPARKSKPVKDAKPAATRPSAKVSFPVETSVGYHIRVTHRMLQRYRQLLVGPYGVTSGMWYFLRVLWTEDGLTQRELSRRVGTMEPTTLVALRSMERDGLIRRVRNGGDRRKVNIYLTPKGRALEKDLLPLAIEVVDRAVGGFSPNEVRVLLNMLERIQANLAEVAAEGAEEIS
jgi:MarR family transcriptional regulator, organic hydroperoxide resistance regulator